MSIFSSKSSLDQGDTIDEEQGGGRSGDIEVEDEDERRGDMESGESAERERWVRGNCGDERQVRERRDEREALLY